MTLQLHPKDWGQLNVRVTMTPTTGADGKVSTQVIAHVVAEHPAVKAALETGQSGTASRTPRGGAAPGPPDRHRAGPRRRLADQRRRQPPESRSGETWGGGQSAAFGTSAQGGSASGGGYPAPFAAFAQGQPERRTHSRLTPAPAQSATETEDLAVPAHDQHGPGGHPRLGETDVRSIHQLVRHRAQRQRRWHRQQSNQSDSQNQFLQLLITELKNQDPNHPTDQTQTLSQLAQFSSLSRCNLNQKMTQGNTYTRSPRAPP